MTVCEVDSEEASGDDGETWMQRVYAPVLRWSLGHKSAGTLRRCPCSLRSGSLGLLAFIPITLEWLWSRPLAVDQHDLAQPKAPRSGRCTLNRSVDQVEPSVPGEKLSPPEGLGGRYPLYQTTIGEPVQRASPRACGPGSWTGPAGPASSWRLEDDAPRGHNRPAPTQ